MKRGQQFKTTADSLIEAPILLLNGYAYRMP